MVPAQSLTISPSAFEICSVFDHLPPYSLHHSETTAFELPLYRLRHIYMPEIICNRVNCGKILADGEALLEHLRRDHPTNIQCYLCLATFGTNNKALIDHFEEKHPEVDGDLKVPCTYPGCRKTAVNSWYLSQHLVLEHGVRR
jgi:hypothetical protein